MSVPTTTLLPFQPATMSTAQLAAVSYLARYAGRTHALYTHQLRLWFSSGVVLRGRLPRGGSIGSARASRSGGATRACGRSERDAREQ